LFTQVTLEAQKSYSSTASSGGKLVFNINKEPRAIPNVENSSTTDAPGDSEAGELGDFMGPGDDTEQLDQVGRAPRLSGPGARAAKSKAPDFDEKTTGRRKR
jgi:hypothetical protein